MQSLLFLIILASTTTFGVIVILIASCGSKIGQTKFLGRKRHITECSAGVIVIRGNAFLFGDTIFCCINNILCCSYESYYRENTQGNGNISSLGITEGSIYRCGNSGGDIVAATATTAMLFGLTNLCAENYGVNRFYDSDRKVLG